MQYGLTSLAPLCILSLTDTAFYKHLSSNGLLKSQQAQLSARRGSHLHNLQEGRTDTKLTRPLLALNSLDPTAYQ